MTIFGAFIDQLFVSMLLLIVILAIIDKRNSEISHPLKATLLGSTIFLIGVSFGMNSGYALNPVRGNLRIKLKQII